ncbi:MAG: alpha/beta hydrolase [Proteobacteria bacterium]|nr:alpha/beta hydrolase [Pseudomonadota bacterium]
MPHIKTSDGVSLYYEETGAGAPLIFLHEFGGHYLSWEPQVRYFSRRYRCITYAARGWPPSDVPNDVAMYSQARAADDCADLMKALGIDKAHLCGLSMGATAGLEFAIRHPGKATALVIAAGGGGGSTDPEARKRFKAECEAFAQRIEAEGMPAMAELYCTSSARNTYRYKDPRGWAEFKQQFADGSATGHAKTMRGVQGSRVPFFERTEELEKITEPMLVVIGDEDESTHSLAVHLKQHVARCGVLELPKCGHTMNLEEPAAFNAAVQDFLHAVENDRWPAREQKSYTLIPPASIPSPRA